ncbi:unnamed protein product [Spirodela intermedia]|uniref:Peptidase A1 domain-containing protein n=1 Tax=Spirodela intermedia TaxID=51605 RepID=A0A7I8JR27_SPIIN|nr:unnamed protein product [Spirodela intermedia]CAA6672235.1 unnamed protein product [Spirodela intermedia]
MAAPPTPFSLLLVVFVVVVAAAAAVAAGSQLPEERKILSLRKLPWEEEKKTPIKPCPPQQSMQEGRTGRRYWRCAATTTVEGEPQLGGKDPPAAALRRVAVRSFQSAAAPPPEVLLPVISGEKLHTLNYVVSIELGSQKTTLIVDTGSDLTWVQCRPCNFCYNQRDPLFDPSSSATYRPVPCSGAACGALQLAAGNQRSCTAGQGACRYAVTYGDGSYTRGELAKERISLGAPPPRWRASELSLVRQSVPQFHGLFSYCLPAGDFDSAGSLVLGGDPTAAYRNSSPVAFTPLLSDPHQSPFYLVNFTGAAVGGVRLQFNAVKVLVDSGTVITRLVPSIYAAVREEFLRQFSGYPAAPPFSILDTCFDLSGHDEVAVPKMKLEFEGGAAAAVDVSGIFYFAKRDASQVCLALASLSHEDQLGIIGNYQQKNLRVVYDTEGSRLGFAEEVCAYG